METIICKVVFEITNKNSKLVRSLKDGSIVYHPNVSDTWTCFQPTHWQSLNVNIVSLSDNKIILTTDIKLINDGVQAIDEAFLVWFINNPSCVEVECNYVCSNCNEDKNNPKYENCHGNYRTHKTFKIVIPKQETDENLTTEQIAWK